MRKIAILIMALLPLWNLAAQEVDNREETPQVALQEEAFVPTAVQTAAPDAQNGESETLADFEEQSREHYSGWVGWIVDKYIHLINYSHSVSYLAVGGLMTLESSFIPFPSEIVIPPAVMVAADPEQPNGMKIWVIVLAGTLGALLGAYINYFLSLWLGRIIIYKFADSKVGHLLRLSSEKVKRAEDYFNAHGVVSTFVGRFIPVIRQLISIPAGLAKMNLGAFTLFTFLGALIWNVVLAVLGYLAAKMGGMAFIYKYSSLLSKIILALAAVVCVWLIVRAIIRKRRQGDGRAE